MNDWRAMKDAPRDGTPILGREPTVIGGVCVCWWSGSGWVREGVAPEIEESVVMPDGWMPCPLTSEPR